MRAIKLCRNGGENDKSSVTLITIGRLGDSISYKAPHIAGRRSTEKTLRKGDRKLYLPDNTKFKP